MEKHLKNILFFSKQPHVKIPELLLSYEFKLAQIDPPGSKKPVN
jgi:hypothetical protein